MQRLDTICRRYSKALGQLKLKNLDHEHEREQRFCLSQSTLFQAYGVFLEEKHDKTTYDWFFNQLISEGAPCEIMICAIAAKISNAPEKEKMTLLAISNQITQLSQEYETNIDLALQYAVLQYVIYHITDSNEALTWKKIIEALLKLGANPWFESNLFFKKLYVFPENQTKPYYFENIWSDQYCCNAFCYMLLTNKINDEVVGIISQFIKHDMSVSLDYFSILWHRLLHRYNSNTISFIERPLFKFLETHHPARFRQLSHENQELLSTTLITGYYRNSNSDFTSANYLDANYQLNIVYLSLADDLKYFSWNHREFFRKNSRIEWWLEKYPIQLNRYIHKNIDFLINGIINNPTKYQQSSLLGSLFQDESCNINLQQSSSDNLIFLNETFQIDIARYKFEDNRSLLYYDSKTKIHINSFYEKRLRLILKFIEVQQPLTKEMSILIDRIRKRPSNTAFDIYFNLIHDIAPNLLKKPSDDNIEKQIYTALASGLTDNNPLSCYVRRKLNMQHYACSFFLGTIPNKDKSLSTVYKFTHHPIYHHWATRKIFDFLDNSPFENIQQIKSRQEVYEVKRELPVSRS